MKYQNNLVGQKVLIIHSYWSKFVKHYCRYYIARIIKYYPSSNLIIVDCKDINRTRFILIDHDDPFTNREYSDDKLSIHHSNNDCNYYVFTHDGSEKILNYNLIHYKNKRCYPSAKIVLTDGIPLITRERKKIFELLLNELKDESN